MTDVLRINPTRQRRFYRCEEEWYTRDVLGVFPLQAPPSPHRDRGKAFHALLEHALLSFAKTAEPFTYAGDEGKYVARDVLSELYRREGTSLSEEASYELLDAARYHLQRLDLAQWEVVRLADGTPLIEADLRAPLIDGVELQAKVDVVLRRRETGKIWLIDFKTTSYPLDVAGLPPFVEHDDQLQMGRMVLVANGITVDYSALLHMRSKAPTIPPLVYVGKKNERTTRNVNDMSCDWDTYRSALIDRGEDPNSAEALKVRDGLQAQAFARWQVDITSVRGQSAVQRNMIRAAERMLSLSRGNDKPIRRLMQAKSRNNCDTCDYGRWCRAAMRRAGLPNLALLGTEYEAADWSPYAGQENYEAPLFDPSQAYVAWAAEQGREIDPHQEFVP